MRVRIFPRTIHRIHRDDDQFADQSPFVKRAKRVRNVPRLIANSWLKKRRMPVVQVKDRIPVIVAIVVSRQEYIDSSLRIEGTLRSKRLVSVKISCDMSLVIDGEIPIAVPEIAAFEHGLAVL